MIRPTDPASPARSTYSRPQTHAPLHDPHRGKSWRERFWTNTAVPLMTSLSLHAGLVAIGLLCFAAFKTVHRVPVEQRESIIPTSFDPPSLKALEGSSTDHWIKLPPEPQASDAGHPGFIRNPGPLIKQMTPAPESNADPDRPLIAPPHGFRTGRPGSPGSPDASGGEGLPSLNAGHKGIFDEPGPGGGGDPGQQPAKPVTSIAYVCDASGSMMEKMPALKRELANAVLDLRPYQKFSIIFFHDEQPTALSTHLLLPIPENRRAAEAFLDDVNPHGTTDPIPGIKLAFAERPQVMFLLTDGDFPNNDAVLAEIRSLEKIHHVQVNTIAFIGSADHDQKFLTLLKQVAQETGGSFRRVDADSLESNGD